MNPAARSPSPILWEENVTLAAEAPKRPDESVRMRRRIDQFDVILGSNEIGRTMNRCTVLQIVQRRQPVSRVELATLSGLQRSTVSQIVEELLREGWIHEGQYRETSRGRRPIMLTLDDNLVVLTADIHPNNATVALIDSYGRLLASLSVPIADHPRNALQAIANGVKRIRDSHPGKRVEGIGISVAGRVDGRGKRMVFAPNMNWPDCDLKRMIEQEIGLPTEIENAANSSLMSELWFGRIDGVRNAVLLTVSEGIGAGILADGKLITGHYGTAGEFGHIPMDPSGPLCGCGQVGCWETLGSSKAALRYYGEHAPASGSVTYRELLHLADADNEFASSALAKQARYLGKGVRMIAHALSPEVVLFAGELASSWERFESIIENELRNPGMPGGPPRLQPVYECDLARLRGAAALVLQRHSQRPRRSVRLPSKQRVSRSSAGRAHTGS